MKYTYPAIFTNAEEGGYCIQFYDLPQAITQGDTIEDALLMAEDVLGFALYDMEQSGEVIPAPSDINNIKVKKNQFVQFITTDTDLQRKYFEKKSVRKNITIPEWMDVYGEQLGLNFSAVLQEALKQKFKVARRGNAYLR